MRPTLSIALLAIAPLLYWHGSVSFAQDAQESKRILQAGAATVDITPDFTPTQPHSIIAGGFLEVKALTITDRLYARAIAISDGEMELAIVVVDTCMMPRELIEKARQLAEQQCGVRASHVTISATHTHTAPAAMGCLGTRMDSEYAKVLPIKIADAIAAAHSKLQPARIGHSSIDDWQHTHNRRWIRKPEAKIVDPFGKATGRAHMHPGYLSRDVIGPSGPVDPELSIVSIQARSGEPIALLANYSQHYFGSKPVSADYYGHFAKAMAQRLNQAGEGNGPFVCAMSQGTSGDLMWMDYGAPAQKYSLEEYAQGIADYAYKAMQRIEYRDWVKLGSVEKRLTLAYRTPDEQRLEWARPIAAKIENDVPKNLQEVYAQEALILHERQRTEILLQALRIGDLTIATLPNEVYALTGLKLKARSPGAAHFNIELAGGGDGYIPPPEQHQLGGYTTWPARTAGLEVQAEPKIVETLVSALEEVTGKPRHSAVDHHGPYAQALLARNPLGYWRLDESDGMVAASAVPGVPTAKLRGGFAWYLPGAGSGSGIGDEEHLKRSAFSGKSQINRAVHLADGVIQIDGLTFADQFTIGCWFWLGQPSGASAREGTVCKLPTGQRLIAAQDAEHRVSLFWQSAAGEKIGTPRAEPIGKADDWHWLMLVTKAGQCNLFVDGKPADSSLSLSLSQSLSPSSESNANTLELGERMQGKLDEIVVFPTAIEPVEIAHLWQVSEMAIEHMRSERRRQRMDLSAMIEKPGNAIVPIKFADDYPVKIESLRPITYAPLSKDAQPFLSSGQVRHSNEGYAEIQAGRLSGRLPGRPDHFTFAVWFLNRLPASTRPVTAYIASRGVPGDATCPGDHLGIGGTYRADLTGKLILFNGNDRNQVVAGRTLLPINTWQHVVWTREGNRVRVLLNGAEQPEIDHELPITAEAEHSFFLAARSDNFAPLEGQLAHCALFDRVLSSAEAKSLFVAAGATTQKPANQASVKSDEVKPSDGPASQPLSPEDSLAALHVARGFRAELVAAEPLVLDPVAFDWDVQGRLWVVEMADYPLGMDGKGQPGGRIRVLKDNDGDGRYDSSHLFAEGLNFPNGIITWRDGVLVTAAPHILYLRDTNGDGRADVQEILFEGFQQGNQQLRLNGLRYGLDHWVYCANGGHHANYGLDTKVTSRRLGQSFAIGSRDFRIQPDSGHLALESGPSQYGRNRDAWGHWFGVQNAKPLWQYVIPDRYLARNPHVPAAAPIHFVLPPGSPPVYPASQPEKRFHSFNESGHFTSACSGMIYNDILLFGKTHESNCFTCEPFHNLVQHNVLVDDGVTYRASRPVGEGKVDFFASEDRWSRPVMVRTGPDGALWVADMYRYMIEHPDWLPPAGKAELLPHYRLGEDRGRIYRIVSENADKRRAWPFTDTRVATLVSAMDSTNDWQRDKAQQLLIWNTESSADKAAAIPLLEQLVRKSPIAEARVQALATLAVMQSLSNNMLSVALGDPVPQVREIALQWCEGRDDAQIVRAMTQMVTDPNEKVCLQLALSLGEIKSDAAADSLVLLAERFHANSFMRTAIMSSTLVHAQRFASGLARTAPEVRRAFSEPLLRQSIGAGDLVLIASMFQNALDSDSSNRLDALDELLLVLQRLGTDLDKLAANQSPDTLRATRDAVNKVAEQLSHEMNDEALSVAQRVAAARTLSRLPDHRTAALKRMGQWLTPQVAAEQQVTILQVLGQTPDPQVPQLLASAWSNFTPALRAQALDVWTSRAASTADLLDRIEHKEVPAASLDLTQRTLLLRYPDAKLASRAKSIFGDGGTRVERQAVLEKYQPMIAQMGNAQRGHEVYRRACASCHRRGGEGFDVGPNLATVLSHSKEKLLRNILDPNADIQPGFQAYTCLLDSGEILSGLLAGETSTSLSIKAAGGQLRTVTRAEIDKLQNLNVSLMPEGLEASVSAEEMRDLLEFLTSAL